MTETMGRTDQAVGRGFQTAVIGTRFGPRASWRRNSLLARRQRESEELFRLKPQASVSGPAPAVSARPVPTPRALLGFVGERHWVVALVTRFAYLFESATAFRSH